MVEFCGWADRSRVRAEVGGRVLFVVVCGLSLAQAPNIKRQAPVRQQ
jgi:hypothetical protein